MRDETSDWPPLRRGQRVLTTKRKGTAAEERREWSAEAIEDRRWGFTGAITGHHDSHGLCYEVRHDDGSKGCYDPEEFELLEPVLKPPGK